MKKAIMKRAWEIYRTLEGDRAAKMSMALREAWEEAKTILEQVRKANAHTWGWTEQDAVAMTGRKIMYGIEARQHDAERGELAKALYAEFEGMTQAEADDYATKMSNDLRGEALDHLKDDKALVKEFRERAKLYIRAYRDLYGVQARPRMMLGVYDTNGANFGQIAT